MKNKFEGKKIILAITADVNLHSCFVDNLEYLGFEVFLLCNSEKFKYKNLYQKVTNFFRKFFFNDKLYKKRLIKKSNIESDIKTALSFPNVDFSLFIRPDLFDLEVIDIITKKSNKNYAYQWDGLERYPEVYDTIPFFDKFYVFDKKDLNYKIKTYPLTNFYFDCYENLIFKNAKIDIDVFYIGSYDNRIDKLLLLCNYLYNSGFNIKIVLLTKPRRKLKKYKFITFIQKPISYIENLKMVANSKAIIDIHHENVHSGLSLRIFEAIGNNKKLITTNPIIKPYDFYNSDNFFLVEDNFKDLSNFVNSEFNLEKNNLKDKYSFTNWISYVLEGENHSKIDIP